jgi:DNA-binding transcriptional MerR regulator
MPDEPYSLADLARLADVTPRTIRYYVAQGLLPSPEAAGPATRYGDGHLARLRLIKRLQRDHLPLAEIRIRLERMEDEEVQALLDASGNVVPEPPQSGAETLVYVQALMSKAGVSPRVHGQAPETIAPDAAPPPPVSRTIPGLAALHALKPPTGAPPAGFFMDLAEEVTPGPAPDHAALAAAPAPDHAAPAAPAPAAPAPAALAPAAPASGVSSRPVAGDRSTWERLVISADVEIHVRRPLDRVANKRVDQLARIARELFDEEP